MNVACIAIPFFIRYKDTLSYLLAYTTKKSGRLAGFHTIFNG